MEGAARALKIVRNSIGPANMVTGAAFRSLVLASFRVLPDLDQP